MSLCRLGSHCIASVFLLFASSSAKGALIYLYDFPGNPGSGLAANQTNGQPAGATFSDFTTNGGLILQGASGQFNYRNWSTSTTLDSTVFEGFSITADPGSALALTGLTFDSMKNGVGPQNAQVSLFLNGSTTPYATFSWAPGNAPIQSYVFDFADLTASDNVTTATFNFYGWNATDGTNQMRFDNVATSGAIASVPEMQMVWPAVFLIMGVTIWEHRRRSRAVLRAKATQPSTSSHLRN